MIVEVILFAIAIVIAAALVIAAYQSGVEEGWRQAGRWADELEATPRDTLGWQGFSGDADALAIRDAELERRQTWHPETGIDRRSGVERRSGETFLLGDPARRLSTRRRVDRL